MRRKDDSGATATETARKTMRSCPTSSREAFSISGVTRMLCWEEEVISFSISWPISSTTLVTMFFTDIWWDVAASAAAVAKVAEDDDDDDEDNVKVEPGSGGELKFWMALPFACRSKLLATWSAASAKFEREGKS